MTLWRGIGTIIALELQQRVRGAAWYVLLGVFFVIVGAVTVSLGAALGSYDTAVGGGIFSTIIYFVLLLGTLVAPAVSGNAINGDREAGTLATTQVTLVTTPQLVIGKFLAAWIMALAFLAAAVPFLLLSIVWGGVELDTVLVSIVVLAVELGVVAAIGVGLSGVIRRPLFSLVVTYLAVAALSIGTLIVFALGGAIVQTPVTNTYSSYDYDDPKFQDPDFDYTGLEPEDCTVVDETTYNAPRFDYFWGALVANPYVVLADASPTHYDENGQPTDLFGYLKFAVRSAQIPPDQTTAYSDCDAGSAYGSSPDPRETIESTAPGWAVGLGIQVVVGSLALLGAIRSTRTPATRLGAGSRVA